MDAFQRGDKVRRKRNHLEEGSWGRVCRSGYLDPKGTYTVAGTHHLHGNSYIKIVGLTGLFLIGCYRKVDDGTS